MAPQAVDTTKWSPTSPSSDLTKRNGSSIGSTIHRKKEDAGEVLLSIITCHSIGQVSLFKRLVRGAIRFDGLGTGRWFHPLWWSRTTLAATLAELEARHAELARVAASCSGEEIVGNNFGSSVYIGGGTDGGKSGSRVAKKAVDTPWAINSISSLHLSCRPLTRCSRLLIHCVRWIRIRHSKKHGELWMGLSGGKGGGSPLIEEESVGARSNFGDGGGCEYQGMVFRENCDESDTVGDDRTAGGWYSFRPKHVQFASSRECYAALHTALIEFETALIVSAGYLDTGGGSAANCHLAEVLTSVAYGLREFFAAPMTTPTARDIGHEREEIASNPVDDSSSPTPAATSVGPASNVAPVATDSKRKTNSDSRTSTDAQFFTHVAAVHLFPENIKLLLMRVLERVYLVGKAVALTASTVLAKPPPPTVVSMTPPPLPTLLKSRPPSPSPPPPSPLPQSKRHRQRRSADQNVGKLGDRAGGLPVKRRETGTDNAGGGGGGRNRSAIKGASSSAGTTTTVPYYSSDAPRSPLFLRSGSAPSSPPLPSKSSSKRQMLQEKASCRGGDGAAAARIIQNSRSKRIAELAATTTAAVTDEWDGAETRLLAAVLPAVVSSSGDCLQLMLAARDWAEALRLSSRGTGGGPCRKRVSF